MHGLLSGLGAAIGDAVYGAIAAFGIGAIEIWITDHQAGLRMVGGLVLLLLAARTVLKRPRRDRGEDIGKIHTESLLQDFISTFLLAIFNPMTMIAFAGLFVTLGVTEAGRSVAKGSLLVTGVFLGSAVWWIALALTANLARPFLDGVYERWITRISAGILTCFAIYALTTALIFY